MTHKIRHYGEASYTDALDVWVAHDDAKMPEGDMKRIALGTVQFGLPYGIANRNGQVSRLIAKDMLQLAEANGVDTLDTAIAYGESEACLGEVGTQCFRLITKLPALNDGCNDVSGWVKEQFAASLSRLGVSEIYGLLLHRPEQLLGLNGKMLYKALQGLKDSGRVQKVGVSIYAPAELELLATNFRFDLVQAPFNLVDRRLYTSGWLHQMKDEGIEVHTRSAFLQGLLLMPRSEIPPRFSPWVELWDKWHEWFARRPVSAIQACLAYPLSFSEIDRVIVGADSVNQLEQIINAAQVAMPNDFPDLSCEDERLVNPANWPQL